MEHVATSTPATIVKVPTQCPNVPNRETNPNGVLLKKVTRGELRSPTQCPPNQGNNLKTKINPGNSVTPICTKTLEVYLEGYDEDKKNYLILGFSQGFSLEYQGPRESFSSANLKSALDNPVVVQEKINKELDSKRVEGPFKNPPFDNFRISPLGLVPKKAPGSWRLIHHLSYPDKKLNSVNAGISDESAAVQYAGIEQAIQRIKILGKNTYLCKTDIRSAFRIVPVNPKDFSLLGFKWNGHYYYDKCLPFGCRTSCKIFEEFSTALEWIALNKLGISAMVHILDDFLILENSKERAISKLKAFIDLCERLGVPLANEKTELPAQIMDFVGITLDIPKQETRLPEDKLNKCRDLLNKFIHLDRCTLKEMQSLIGVLNFACSVIQPGRAFLRRLINLTMHVSSSQTHIFLTDETKKDMKMWQKFLISFNGKSIFLNETFLSSHTLELHTDAAQSLGYAGIYKDRWFNGVFPPEWQKLNIMTLEFYPIILAIYVWGPLRQNHSILFFTDNESLVSVINKQTSRDDDVMKMVRFMVLQCLNLNILFKAKHIPGKKNVLADHLSRLQVNQFLNMAPLAQKKPCKVPHHLQPQNFWESLES